MFAAINIIACLLFTCVAMSACAVSLMALKRHLRLRQLFCTSLIMVANVIAVSGLYESVVASQNISLLLLVLTAVTFVLAMVQFAVAALLGGLGRLRARMR